MRGVNLGRRGRGALFSPVCDPRPRRVKSDLVAEYLSALPHRGCSPLFTTSTVISTATPWDGKQPRDYEIRRGDEWPGKDLGTRVCRMCLCRERARGVLQGLRALTVMGFPSRHVSLSCTPSPPPGPLRALVSACPSANAVSAAIRRKQSSQDRFSLGLGGAV